MGEDRTLTDEDVRAIAEALEGRLKQHFFLNVGRGVWALAWRGIVALMLILALYGAFRAEH